MADREIRCPACLPLGWADAHLLMLIPHSGGFAYFGDLTIETKCPRCKSVLVCEVTTFHVIIKTQGKRFVMKK